MSKTQDFHDLFFAQLKTASSRTDAHLEAGKKEFQQAVEKIVLEGNVAHVYPRHASKQADDRIERLVAGIEDIAAFNASENAAGKVP
jgi:hypothetical protein